MKKLIIGFVLLVITLLTSCADSQEFVIDGKPVYVEPYGWANYQELKNDSIIYEANMGNIVWSVILSETIVVPVWLTGWQFYEPVRKK